MLKRAGGIFNNQYPIGKGGGRDHKEKASF
jgi:hypothetical protein